MILINFLAESDPANLTAAIGDGGNDVSMLQEAHIGLGIIGHEGSAAAQASDFAFTKFRFLKRALLVHGHWYYFRAAFLIQYSFYKNIAFCTGQFLFMFFNNYSANTIFDSFFLVMYNTIYSSLPVLVFAILEKNISADKLLKDPRLYTKNRKNNLMSHQQLLKWSGLAVWHSLATFFTLYFVFTQSDTDFWTLQTAMAQAVVIVVNMKLLLESRYWNVYLGLSILFSILSFSFLTFFLQFVFHSDNFLVDSSYYLVYTSLLADLRFWAGTALAVPVALLPDILMSIFSNINIKPKCNTTVPFVEPAI